MSANRPSASAARVLLAKFAPNVESAFALDLRRIATNTGEYKRSVNSAGGIRLSFGAGRGGRSTAVMVKSHEDALVT